MAKNKLSIALELGGVVSSSLGSAFKTVDGHISKLEAKGNKAKVLKGMIGDTQRLQAEWKKAHDTGAAGADKLLRKLDSNLDSLRKQGVEVGRLSREYQRLGREAKAADLQLKGHQQIQQGKDGLKSNLGRAAIGVGLAAVPTTISAGYQAIIRDIAIKSDIVNKPQEAQLSRAVIDTARDTGMSRNDVADLINQLVGAGMDVEKAMAYAPTAAKFAIGQGSSGVDTAAMIQALQQNAKITDPKVMQQALEAIAYQGQAGSFEAADMAKWFPQLLAGMEKNGVTGLDAVTSLGAMLQVQMKTAGSSDEAANNFKNWMEKIGAGDIQRNYEKAGIDYQKSLNTGLQKGMNVFEASMGLAMQYIEKTDPKKALELKEAQAKIDKEVDPEKATKALQALEKSLRTGDVFADQQVKAALTAYAQNRGLYNTLKADSADAKKVAGILDKNLAERRETSAQRWSELGQAMDDSMRSIGDAIRPATDMLAVGLTKTAHVVTDLSDRLPGLALGVSGVAAAVMTFLTARSAVRIGRGVFNLARGRGMERGLGGGGAGELPATGNKVVDAGLGVLGKVLGGPASNDPGRSDDPQRVFVVNASAIGGLGSPAGADAGASGKRRRGRRARRQTGGAFGNTRVPAPRVATPGMATIASEAAGALDGKAIGRTVRSLRGITRGLSKIPGGKLVDAIPGVIDTALNAETRDEKAEGYGSVAGGLAGAWAGGSAGAATGALIGSIVPGIGTAIGGVVGGAIGAVLGGIGGESVGGYLGKKVFGGDEAKPEAPTMVAKKADPPSTPAAPAVSYDPLDPNSKDPFLLPALTANRVRFPGAGLVPPQGPATGDVVRELAKASPPAPSVPEIAKAAAPKVEPPKVDQSFAFSPNMAINVQGDVKDPAQLVREMEGPLRAMFDTFSREQAARQSSTQLFDPAHV
ncbi:phage tail tape measure protein, TP901 family, core region [Pseudomonas guariconensis]|uniref:phage tail tape measure protein n=1 Tax=Pseudomonas guariconensis TaxID=1288410 RepID=UPI00088AEB09|nr:phage tail tape measure protein [Pseudomonas guariconensis]SDC64766.1 phage tail tape measure protein, TP901 family, core region [Pseudomonas guariconensis]